ncbi:MAG: hypothetical protein CMM58_05675 [Rhodospirillaceae bacterium]|nr:hypothetical protein [Rhodospirillaceae bacterium]
MEAGAVLVETIVNAGVDTAFTVPGESFLPVLEALRINTNRIRLVSVRQEGGGSLAAHGFGQVGGKPAAVFVSRGPGATNASIGLHAAHQDSVPMVMFVGHVRSHMIGRESFQEIDHQTAFKSMSKAVFQPSTPEEMILMARQAVELSTSGRPGPVVVVMPRDFGDAQIDMEVKTEEERSTPMEPDKNLLDELAHELNKANYPLIIAGELARQLNPRNALACFAKTLGAPILASYRCQDVIDNLDNAYAGHLEINPVKYQNLLVDEADYIVVVGSRLDGITSREETLISREKHWAHIHVDSNILGRFNANLKLACSVDLALTNLIPNITAPPQTRLAWRDQAHQFYLNFSKPGSHPVRGKVDLSKIADTAGELLPQNAVVLTDGGSYARWIHRFFRFRAPLTQGGTASGAMGAGVPGAIGAALATNDGRPVVAFAGDGGFMMTGQELSTAVREKIPIKVVVCDNDVHGSIIKGQWDKYGIDHAFGTVMQSPDFVKIAKGYGAAAWAVDSTELWASTFEKALAHDGPALIHIKIDSSDIAPYGNEKDAV